MPAAVSNGRQSIMGPARVISGQREEPEIYIEDNVPIPQRLGRPKASKYPIRALNVGQSFFIEGGTRSTAKSCEYVAKTAGIKITTRLVKQGAVSGLRVWRVE